MSVPHERHTWRPQAFGSKAARNVRDPLIEPLWEGTRVLVLAERGAVIVRDVEGDTFEIDPAQDPSLAELVAAIGPAVRAKAVILDGYLTEMATRSTTGVVPMDIEAPSSTEMAAQMLMGSRFRRKELVDSLPTSGRSDGETPVAFVAVDVLAIDDASLLEVPLLERKRQLESVLAEGPLVRLGAYVRPPIDPWLGSWRSLGFHSLAYKAANSRYRPGQRNDAWALARIPQR